ncbi:MAG: site-specific integrase [Pirellulales bacterium]
MRRARRGRGEGSIYQRTDGTWCATYSAGYAASGKRVRKTIFGVSKDEVAKKLSKVQATRMDGTFVEPSRTRLSAFLERWVEDAARPTIRQTTYFSYKGIIRNHIDPRIGGTTLSILNPVHIQRLYADMERDGVGPRVRQLTHAVLRRALKQALRWGLIARNPCDAIDPPRVPKRQIAPLTAEQVQQLLDAAKDGRLYALYVVAIGTGMRLGEIFGLQWPDVDLKGRAINVRSTLIEINGKLSLAEPKTPKSRRRVDLPQVAVDAVTKHRAQSVREGFAKEPWVFCNSIGGPLRRTHFHVNHFKPLLATADLPAIRFHDLRHTSATLLLAAGVHPKVVQERLGHSQIGITLDTYSHVVPTMQLEAAAKLDTLMRSSTRVPKLR